MGFTFGAMCDEIEAVQVFESHEAMTQTLSLQ